MKLRIIIFPYLIVNVDTLQNAKEEFKQLKFVTDVKFDFTFTIDVISELLY